MIPGIAFHYDEKYYPSPEKFDPERFSPEEVAKRPNLAFLPFGEGPRNCIGMRFGIVNVKFAVASLIKNFKVTADTNKSKFPLKLDPTRFSMYPIGGFWARFEKIQN